MKNFLIKDNDIKKWVAVTVALLAVALKLVLAYGQYATVYPPLAPIDDHLMFKAAQSIVAGKWLGEYGWLTISKHMFFALWLAFLNAIKMPYLVGNMALWALACLFAVMAVKPVVQKNWQKLFMFLGLLYNPAMSAQYATRIYRDAIFPSLCLMFVAGIVAVGLRYKEKTKTWLGWMVMYGTSFGCIYLCREDGMWIMPFFAAAAVIVTALLIFEKEKNIVPKVVCMVLPFAISTGIICGYSYMNYTHYGVFATSDFSQGSFTAAYGALTSIEQDSWHPLVSVPADVREDVYAVSPAFAQVKNYLDSEWYHERYVNANIGDYGSGSLYWALREAVSELGYYENAEKASRYFETVYNDIQAAVDSGVLKTTSGKKTLRNSVTPPIKMEYVPDVLAETFAGFKTVMLFEQCDPLAEKAVGYPEEIKEVEDFIRQSGATAMIENTDIPYLSPVRSLMHTVLRVFIQIYRYCIPVMFLIGLAWQIKKLRADIFAKKYDNESMLNIIMLGLLGMALLRCAMIAFVEVASFNIGTYVMYLSTVHPLLILYCFIGFVKSFEY